MARQDSKPLIDQSQAAYIERDYSLPKSEKKSMTSIGAKDLGLSLKNLSQLLENGPLS